MAYGEDNLDEPVKEGSKMEKDTDLDEKHDFFSAKRYGNVIMLSFRGNLLLRATDLSARDEVLDYFDRITKSNSIKAVVIFPSTEKTGREEYLEFCYHLSNLDWNQSAIGRFLNIVDQLILTIVDLNKIVIHAYSGRVLSLFLNMGLACDYRIVADNTVFQNPSLELGIVPIGGGAFFLPKMLGYRKAYEILLSGRDITAHEAISLGIVDRIEPLDKLEETALEMARRFSQKPVSSLSVIRRLLNYSRKDLEGYLRLENKELLRIFLSSDFQDKIRETHV